jgi:hypothetical protein
MLEMAKMAPLRYGEASLRNDFALLPSRPCCGSSHCYNVQSFTFETIHRVEVMLADFALILRCTTGNDGTRLGTIDI